MFDSYLFAARSTSGARISGVDLRSLPDGTKVVVETCNSRYRLVLHEGDGCNAVVQGGAFFSEETEVRIDGSTPGGSLLKVGWIGLGLFLEFSVRGERILTSRIRSIRIETGGRDESSPPASEDPQPRLGYSPIQSAAGDWAATLSR